jgi:hypothetical protein
MEAPLQQPDAELRITAQPVGTTYCVPTRGLGHIERRGRNGPPEAASDNFVQYGFGCYRRTPTCRD